MFIFAKKFHRNLSTEPLYLFVYLLTLGMFLILTLVCLNNFNMILLSYSCSRLLLIFLQSWLLIIEFCFSFFSIPFSISVFTSRKVERRKIISFTHCKYCDSQWIFFIMMFCFDSHTKEKESTASYRICFQYTNVLNYVNIANEFIFLFKKISFAFM